MAGVSIPSPSLSSLSRQHDDLNFAKTVFEKFDHDKSGDLSHAEIAAALTSFLEFKGTVSLQRIPDFVHHALSSQSSTTRSISFFDFTELTTSILKQAKDAGDLTFSLDDLKRRFDDCAREHPSYLTKKEFERFCQLYGLPPSSVMKEKIKFEAAVAHVIPENHRIAQVSIPAFNIFVFMVFPDGELKRASRSLSDV